MKSKLIWLIFALILIGIIFSVVNNKKIENGEFKPLEINVGDEFSYIDYDNKMYVLKYDKLRILLELLHYHIPFLELVL